MSIFSIIGEALISLTKNKVRTALSMLGIVIGVASVITMVAMGQGTKAAVEAEIEALGDDWMFIGYWGMARSGVRGGQELIPPLQTVEEARLIMADCSAVRAATPSNRISMQVKSAYNNYRCSIYGAWPQVFDIRRWDLVRGRFYTAHDEATLAKVCVIGQSAASELFGSIDPVGETIHINRAPYEVIGLLEPKGSTSDGRDNDDVIFVPNSTCQARIAGPERSQTILAAARDGESVEKAKAQITALLRQAHRLQPSDPDDFRIYDLSENAETKSNTSKAFGNLLLVVASVSLVVGGVGIMNIMLVSVTERTREIGLRMALGAHESTILGQFLTEAVLLCAIGGLLGMGLGALGADILERKYAYDILVPSWAPGVAVAFSALVGVFFGFYPAWRASRLDPIEALRYE
jgi:putative ABC transport system permease protein